MLKNTKRKNMFYNTKNYHLNLPLSQQKTGAVITTTPAGILNQMKRIVPKHLIFVRLNA